jgi:hypothetical protein
MTQARALANVARVLAGAGHADQGVAAAERDGRHGRPPTRRSGSAGCCAAELVGLRDVQEVGGRPGGAVGGKRSPMEIPAVLSFAVLLWLG